MAKTIYKSGGNVDLFEAVTNKIVGLLEKGMPPWQKTWGEYGLACNYYHRFPYRGINMLLLNLATPYGLPYYLTWQQVQDNGGKVIKGSKAEWIYFYKTYYKDADGNTIGKEEADGLEGSKRLMFLKRYKVFNVECISGIEFKFPENVHRDNASIENCEELIGSMDKRPGFRIEERTHPAYDPKTDMMLMPPIGQFKNSEEYYNTTFHEIIHWTGHPTRLNRPGIRDFNSFGSNPYALEELIAELGACYLCALTGIDREKIMENNAAYLEGWLQKFRDDKYFLFRAASAAQKAVDFIIGKETKT